MKRFSLILIALANVACAATANAAMRPHYGGTLRVTMQESPQSLDPSGIDSSAVRSLWQLVFETLVRLDDHGRPQPSLATTWQAEPGNQRWRFRVRSGVIFSDGTPLDANVVAASLRSSNPQWKIFALGELVMVETDSPHPNLPAELALPRNSISRASAGMLIGTGPFTVTKWDTAAKHLSLSANNQYWAGRPFIDSVEIDTGKTYRDQMMLLDLGKADLVEIAPETMRSVQSGTRVVVASAPEELMALVFTRDAASSDDMKQRLALERSIDTTALNNVVFQSGGEPAGALLPNWLSGYAFLFPSGQTGAAGVREKLPSPPAWTLGYDASDAAGHIVADRVALNAKDAGITLQLVSSANADLRLTRFTLPSLVPQVSIAEFARQLHLPLPMFTDSSVTSSYSAENALLQTRRIIPLLHLRSALATRPNVRGLVIRPDGAWSLREAWLSPETP